MILNLFLLNLQKTYIRTYKMAVHNRLIALSQTIEATALSILSNQKWQ